MCNEEEKEKHHQLNQQNTYNIYSKCRDELLERQLSNAENFDKAIISLSTAALGFSLAFIKDIVSISQAKNLNLLIISWFLFVVAIVITLFSYIMSQWGIDIQLNYAKKYYIDSKKEYFEKTNIPAKITYWLNIVSGLVFVLAIVLTVFFVSFNLTKGNPNMNKDKEKQKISIPVGTSIPKIQKINFNEKMKGALIPNLAPIPQEPNLPELDRDNNCNNPNSNKTSKTE